LAVSAKRYVLFNRAKNGQPIIRKASAHGLGDVELPTDYTARYEHVTAPIVKDEGGETCWLGRIINRGERAEIDPNDYVPATRPQLKAIGARLGARRYVRKDQRRFSKSSPSISVRQYQQAQHGVTLEKRASRYRRKPKIAGSAGALFLDMWTEAILELDRKGNLDGVDDIICKWPELNVPQHSQTTLSTRDAWLKYKSLPGRRAFQFFITLPAPKITFGKDLEDGPMFAELKEAEGSSLYTSFSKPFKLDIDNVYRRDTNEPIRPYLETGMELQTVADRVRGYFAHNEAKSVGNVGLLERKCVIGLSKAWIGKESHPYADTLNDAPDDETLETYKSGVAIVGGELNHDLIARAGVSEVARAARIDEKILLDVVVNRKDLRGDLKARLFKAISVDDGGQIHVEKVPIRKQETDLARVRAMLVKHGKIRLLGEFIHAAKAAADRADRCNLEDADVSSVVAAPPGGNWKPIKNSSLGSRLPSQNGQDATHKKIFQDLDRVCSLCPPVFLSLAEIEHHARDFHGIEKGLKKKADRKARQAEYFKSTVAKKQERWSKAKGRKREEEINRVAELWKLPEIRGAKNIKGAHRLDKILSTIAGKGFKAKAIVYSSCLEPSAPSEA
jgi:hypothetical protein